MNVRRSVGRSSGNFPKRDQHSEDDENRHPKEEGVQQSVKHDRKPLVGYCPTMFLHIVAMSVNTSDKGRLQG